MPYRPADFRSTVVKPYYIDESNNNDITIAINTRAESKESTVNTELKNTNKESTLLVNKENAQTENAQPVKRGRGRLKKSAMLPTAYITAKEKADYDLFLKLRKDDIITTPRKLFKLLNKKEIDALVARGVFAFKQYDEHKYSSRIFKSRIVRKVKGKQTSTPYKKSRLVI